MPDVPLPVATAKISIAVEPPSTLRLKVIQGDEKDVKNAEQERKPEDGK